MAEIVTLRLPDTLAVKAREVAALTHRQLEEVLVEFIDRALTELPIESLPNDQLLALCNMQMDNQQQELLSDLLARNTEGQLNQEEITQLNEIMQVYRHGLIRKGRAIKVAVERGLIPSLN